jgi:hypothetical protein
MHHRAPFLCTLLAALLLGAVALPAAGAEPVTARWRFSGIPGEPVNAIAIARDNPQLIYAVTGGDNVPSPYPISTARPTAARHGSGYTKPFSSTTTTSRSIRATARLCTWAIRTSC